MVKSSSVCQWLITQGTSDSVAEMGHHGMECTRMKLDGGALFTISQALCDVVSGLINSLEEFQNVGNALDREISGGVVECSPDEPRTNVRVEANPLLLVR